MKIGPKPPLSTPIDTTPSTPTAVGATKTPFKETLSPSVATQATAATRSSSATAGRDPLSLGALQQVLAQLRTGSLSLQAARESLAHHVAAARGHSLSAPQQQKLAAALDRLLSEDPYLSARFDNLTQSAPTTMDPSSVK